MKLFEKNGKADIHEYELVQTGETVIYKTEYLDLVPETVDYLLDESERGTTITRIRQLIASLFHYRNFPAPDIFSLMRNADDEHAELVINILESCSPSYGDSCFKMINDLAPEIIERFNLDRQS